jgi:hypothetical protein
MLFCYNIGSFLMLSFIVCDCVVFCYPMIHFLFVGKKILHFGFSFPGIDWQSPFGYSINFAFHSLQTCYVINVLVFGCFCSMFFILNAFAQYEVLESYLDDLSLLATGNENRKNEMKINACIKKIADEHVKLIQ